MLPVKILALAFGALLAFLWSALAQDKPVILKLSDWVPPAHPLQKAIQDATEDNNTNAEKSILADREKVLASGKTTLHTLTEEQLAAWRQAMAPVWTQFEGQIGSGLIRSAQAANR